MLRILGSWDCTPNVWLIAPTDTHVVYQLFRRCGPVGHPAKHLLNQWSHSWIHSVIKSGSRSSSQIHWFIHASGPSVSQRPNQKQIERIEYAVDTDADGWTRPGSQPTWSCWLPADLLMFLSSAGPGPSRIQPTIQIPYSLSLFRLQKKKEIAELRCISQRLLCLGFTSPYWVFTGRGPSSC